MRPLVRFRSLWWNLARRRRVDEALDEEVRAYIDLLAADYERAGMTPAAAHRAALLRAGGVEQVKESTRDAWAGNTLAVAARELRHAARSLRKSPAFVAFAVATLAIGIAGATAVFTMIDAALLRPLPAVVHPEGLVSLERVEPTTTLDDFAYPDFRDFRDQSTTLAGLAAYNGTSMALQDRGGDTRAWVGYASGELFSVLGVHPVIGRLFGAADVTTSGADPVVVLGYGLWQRRYHADSSVIGSTLRLDGLPFTVIGVAPPRFIGAMRLHAMEMWIPLTMIGPATHALSADIVESRAAGWLRTVGRLAPGRSVADAQSDLSTIAARLAAAYRTNKGRGVHVYAGAGMTADERVELARLPRLLAIAVALLLLIACTNVASLSLIRASARRREMATRLALGASRVSIARQLFLEGALIAAGATVAGVLVSMALVRTAPVVDTVVGIAELDVALDRRVLAVAVAAAVLTAVLVSMLPALQAARTDIGMLMKDGAGGAVRRRSRGQRALVVVQVAASLVLLASAAIVHRSIQRTLAADPGFDTRAVTYAIVDARSSGYDSTRARVFYRALLDRAASAPGIAEAALTSTIPPQQWSTRVSVFRPGEEPPPGALAGREFELGLRVYTDGVSPNLLRVLRIPVLRGRDFTAADDEHGAPVVVVSRRLAETLWPGADPVGRYLAWPAVTGPARPLLRVIGVAADTRHASLTGDPPLVMYVPFAQHADLGAYRSLVLKGRGTGAPPTSLPRRLVASLDPGVAVLGASTLEQHVAGELRPERVATAWIGVFGVVALLLAALGVYGIVMQGVLQRTRELAVRAALGAAPGGLLVLILGDGLHLTTLGALVGSVGSIAAFRVLRTQFAAVGAIDALSALLAAGVLALAMLAASYLPARRAARLNPADALRSD